MRTDLTNGRISDPENPAVAEFHSYGEDIFAINQALLGLKKNASNEGVKRLKKHLLATKQHVKDKRARALEVMHMIDQDNKP